VGKKVKTLRRNGKIPATVYEKGKDSINVQVDAIALSKVLAAAGTNSPVELKVDKKVHLTMVKFIDVNPAKNMVSHVSFHAVNKNDTVEAEIPVHIEGDVPAEQKGNFVVRPNDTVLVKAIPAKLPEVFVVAGELLAEAGDSIKVRDIAVVADVEILSDVDMILAAAEEPRAAEEPAAEASEGEEKSDTPDSE